MKTKKNNQDNRAPKVRSFEELKLEKSRLRMEVLKTEEGIRTDYHKILDAFTFSRIVGNVAEQLASKTSVLSKTFAAGKKIVTRFREKKKKKKNLNRKS